MSRQRIFLIILLCYPLALLIAKPVGPLRIPPRQKGMTDEEYENLVKKSIDEHKRQERERQYEIMDLQADKAWQSLLRISDRQWSLIKPKYEKVRDLGLEAKAHAAGWGGKESFRWNRHSDGIIGAGKTREQMPEGFRIVEGLIDLLEDEKSKDEEIRKKIDALQQARDNAWEALPKARRELAVVLTTPRQEAIFLLLGCID
jgi:hypothetical protein